MSAPYNPTHQVERIRELKERYAGELLILTHHYQRREIVALGHFRGDSFGLSLKAAQSEEARFIVFCGVHFMAESAAILARPQQTVQIPDLDAGCWMADMSEIHDVEGAWEEVTSLAGRESVVPIVYMNSDAHLKAFCGRHGGAVCTSSNARAALRWGFTVGRKILFFPDRHLGRNIGNEMGLKPRDIIVWDPKQPSGGNTHADIHRAKLILWDGYCLVHTRFEVDHVRSMREKYPEARIVVHPECTQEVVALADACGSTSFIVNYVKNAAPGTTIVIGTEINLIHRLALEHPDKKVMELHRSLCPNMFRINLKNLLWTLEGIGKFNVVAVPEAIKADARLALDRMLKLPS